MQSYHAGRWHSGHGNFRLTIRYPGGLRAAIRHYSGSLLIRQQLAERGLVPLRLTFLGANKLRRLGAADALAGHFANNFGSGECLFLALARHGFDVASSHIWRAKVQ
jgi:hypothetical protein